MPPRTRTTKAAKPAPAPEPEVDETDEEAARYERLMEKEPTQKQLDCADWIQDKTGYECDPKTVQLVLSLYSTFQRSPENQEAIAKAKENAAAQAEKRANAAEDRKERKAKAGPKPARRSSRATEDDDETEDEAPAKPTRRRATAVSGAPRARRTRAAASEDFD